MKKTLVQAAALLVAILLWPTLAAAQKVSYDFEKSEDFTRFKTYALKDGTKVGDPLIDKRISDAIEEQLKAKGLSPKADSPDIVVVYHMAFDKEQDITTYSTGMGYGPYPYHWGGGFGSTQTRVNQILIGTLVVDIADAQKNEIVWRGMGVKEVDTQKSPEKRDKSITQAVTKIFKNYPPKVKK
jgi:hypothetical protein